MIKSMTAYSRRRLGRYVVEIHSVNRKMLDLSVYLPKEFLRFDIPIRKWLGKALERGQVTLRLNLEREAEGQVPYVLSQLKGLKASWEKICLELGFDGKQMVNLPFLVSQLQSAPPSDANEDEEVILSSLKEVVEGALQDLLQMKEVEGKTLVLDMQKRLKIIEENCAAIELKKELPLHHFRSKLLERLKEIGGLHAEVEERVAREVALLADKMDITEEIVRLRAHLEQFRHHLVAPEKAVGRTLDFLTQEMHREVNTLGSKSSDTEISLFVVKMKSELDKIREQVQNIE
jgi:uncharacterized protein (TIGR00255 family)